MNETAIFPRFTCTDPFVVEVLDFWSWINEFERESRKIVDSRVRGFGLREGEPDRGGERIQWSAARSDADKHSTGERTVTKELTLHRRFFGPDI